MKHTCHAIGCTTPVPPKMMMCITHWRMVSQGLQGKVYAAYRPGQEKDKQPSREYLKVLHDCQREVRIKETGIDPGPHPMDRWVKE